MEEIEEIKLRFGPLSANKLLLIAVFIFFSSLVFLFYSVYSIFEEKLENKFTSILGTIFFIIIHICFNFIDVYWGYNSMREYYNFTLPTEESSSENNFYKKFLDNKGVLLALYNLLSLTIKSIVIGLFLILFVHIDFINSFSFIVIPMTIDMFISVVGICLWIKIFE